MLWHFYIFNVCKFIKFLKAISVANVHPYIFNVYKFVNLVNISFM
jgi:hypothetical protein